MIRKSIAAIVGLVAAALVVVACDDRDALEHCKEVCAEGAGCNTITPGCVQRCDADHALIADSSCDGHANALYDCYQGEGVCTPDVEVRCATEKQALADCEGAYCLAHAGAAGCPSAK